MSVAAWTLVTITLTFIIIKALVGLHVSEEEELQGLDPVEHALAKRLLRFSISDVSNTMTMDINQNTSLGASDYRKWPPSTEERSHQRRKTDLRCRYRHTQGCHYYQAFRCDKIKNALNELGVTGMTVTQVMGCGIQKGSGEMYRGVEVDATLLPKVKIEGCSQQDLS